jgi:energy-coupling factor transport system substrate-specific component
MSKDKSTSNHKVSLNNKASNKASNKANIDHRSINSTIDKQESPESTVAQRSIVQTPTTARAPKKTHRFRWRVVDIAVASVIGVASSFIFWICGFIPFDALQAVIPGFGGIVNGLWLFAGPLCALIIRKPGAAFYAELLASTLESLMGNQWSGAESILIGLVEGIGGELIFLILVYKVWKIWVAALAGGLAGVASWAYTFLTHLQGIDADSGYGAIYLVTTVISGVVIAGILMWYLMKALAKTGVLDSFAVGRAAMKAATTKATMSAATGTTTEKTRR